MQAGCFSGYCFVLLFCLKYIGSLQKKLRFFFFSKKISKFFNKYFLVCRTSGIFFLSVFLNRPTTDSESEIIFDNEDENSKGHSPVSIKIKLVKMKI